MSGHKVPLPSGWEQSGGTVFTTDNFEEDVRVVRRKNRETDLIEWCAWEDGQLVGFYGQNFHAAVAHFEEDWEGGNV